MRMHSIGKCSPNIIVGALLIFSIIVLFNYWNISTFNHDLTLKVHSLEQQVVSMSRINDALQSNWDKANQDKTRVEMSMKQVSIDCETAKVNYAESESAKKRLTSDLDNMKRENQQLKAEGVTNQSKAQAYEREIGRLKDKIISLEAQVVEKKNTIQRLEKQMSQNTRLLEEAKKAEKSSTVSTAKSNNSPAQFQAEEPVLMNDPAVPYPNGWMDPKWSSHLGDLHGHVNSVGKKGIKNFGQVIIFDDPKTPRKKPRFSVVDPPKYLHGNLVESQMNPQMNNIAKPMGLQSPLKQEGFPIPDTAGEVGRGAQGPNPLGNEHLDPQEGPHGGVLPLPAKQPQQENLDAQEDDKDRNLKDEMALADDQSPDGELGFNKDILNGEGVGPPPNGQRQNLPMVYQKVNNAIHNNAINPNGGGGQSGQDFREAAHVNE